MAVRESSDPSGVGARNGPQARFGKVVGRLVGVNAVFMATTLITGPVLARALGVEDRGNLAAVLVPIGFVGEIGGLGLGVYAQMVMAQGRDVRTYFASLAALTALLGVVVAAVGVPLSHAIADGRHVVQLFLLIGFFLMPLNLQAGILRGMTAGAERWSLYTAARLIPPVGALIGLVTLSIFDAVTVASAATVTIAFSLLSSVPMLALLRGTGGKFRVRCSVVREGLSYGLRSWFTVLGSLTNQRLDQVLMAGLVAPRVLGLYAVSFSLANFSSVLTGAISQVLLSRVASGDAHLAARSLRVVLAVVVLSSLVVGVMARPLLRLLFGEDFAAAAPIVWLLLAAGVPLAGLPVLGSALNGAGFPGRAGIAQMLAVCITVPGLLLVLKPYGGEGAACVSVAAYSANFVVLLHFAREQLGGTLRSWLLIEPDDLRWFLARIPRSSRR